MTTQTSTLPSGSYIIGDVCFSIDNENVYLDMVDDLCDTEVGMVDVPNIEPNENDEKYLDEDGEMNEQYDEDMDEYEANPVRGQIFTYNTHADGVYDLNTVDGSFVQELGSDAANISLIPVELADTNLTQKMMGRVLTFENEFTIVVTQIEDYDNDVFESKMVVNNEYVINF